MSSDRVSIALALFVLAGCASTSMTPRASTREEVVAYVNRAAALVAKNGPSCATLKEPRWASGDWYIYVQEANGPVVCHPNGGLVGRPASSIIDANGKHVGDDLAAAGAKGGGWVDYVWPRPGQTMPVPKSTYVTRVTGPDGKTYYLGSGGYDLK